MQKNVSRGWLYATIILALAVASLAWERHEKTKALRDVFHYSYRVTVRDFETGEVLNSGIEHPLMSSSDLFAQTTGSMSYEDGSVRISGIAYTPRTYVFGHPGYKAKRFTISRDMPIVDEVVIRLTRSPSTEENNSGQQDGTSNGG
jgi:hypothetical protein